MLFRSELKKTKVEQMERAKRLGKQKATRVDDGTSDLEKMVALIGKASGRKLVDQSAEMSSSSKAKLEQAKQQDAEKVSLDFIYANLLTDLHSLSEKLSLSNY